MKLYVMYICSLQGSSDRHTHSGESGRLWTQSQICWLIIHNQSKTHSQEDSVSVMNPHVQVKVEDCAWTSEV